MALGTLLNCHRVNSCKNCTVPIRTVLPCSCERDISELSEDTLPPIQPTDIFNYLVLGTSFCTSQRFKAFKSLEAYKYFESGFVMSVNGKVIDNKFVTLGKVCYTDLHCSKHVPVFLYIGEAFSTCQ